jgi:hypothetical protein
MFDRLSGNPDRVLDRSRIGTAVSDHGHPIDAK